MSDQPRAFPTAVKKSPRSHHRFVTFLYNLVHCLTNNPNFVTTTPTVAELEDTADDLAAANARAEKGGPLAVADRNAKRDDAEKLIDQLVLCVRMTVRAQAGDPTSAAAMIVSSGLSVRKQRSSRKPLFAAKYGPVSGVVLLVARTVAKSAMYLWELSLDQTNWSSIPQTMQASTTIAGLIPAKTYFFRFRAQTRKGMGDYSQVISLLVH